MSAGGDWFGRGPDRRTRDHWDAAARVRVDGRPAGPAFSRMFAKAFVIAALIGLVCGVIGVLAGLWHFHVHPLF